MLNELKLNASLIYLHSILPGEWLSQGDPSDNENCFRKLKNTCYRNPKTKCLEINEEAKKTR